MRSIKTSEYANWLRQISFDCCVERIKST